MRRRVVGTVGIGLALLGFALAAGAQSIVLDTPVKAGAVQLFPKVRDEKVYYYAPIRPRLARDDAGRPQFSFLRYVQTVEGQGEKDAPKEGEGGGIVHALVTLSVTPEELEAARQELGRLKPGAKIEGPVIYKSGTFGLVSSFTNKEGDLSKQVVGLGRAPVLDGAKAAVSIQLTKLGAKILWESFQTPAPDISFSFDMELEGYLSPKQATVEAEWDRVYSHESFSAAIAGQLGPVMLAAEINAAFDELREQRAIRVTQIGDDKQMEQLVATTYNKLIEQMFQPIGGTGAPNLGNLGVGGDKPSLLDKATSAYNQRRKEVDQANAGRHARNEERIRKHNAAVAAQQDAVRLEREANELDERARQLDNEAARAWQEFQTLEAGSQTGTRAGDGAPPPTTSSPDTTTTTTPAETQPAPTTPPPVAETTPAPTPLPPAPETQPAIAPTPLPAPEPQPSPATPQPIAQEPPLGSSGGVAPPQSTTPTAAMVASAKARWYGLQQQAKDTRTAATERRKAAQAAREKATALAADRQDPKQSGTIEEQESRPVAQLMASYEMKKIRQTGTFRLDLNKYSSSTLNLRFDENIGDLRRYWGEARHFHQVNLDDPLYRQREIAVFIDGLNATDFGEFVNFVSIHLKKVHGNGKETHEEVRIDRKNFNQEGNRFRMIYGWNGDDDRRKWMDYEYQTVWSFFGGETVEEPWRSTSAGAISVSPPFQPRAVTLDADPEVIKSAGVRAITVRLYYMLNQNEHVKQATLNPLRDQLSERINFLLPANQQQYEYDVSWKLRGNKSAASGRQKGNDAILFIDELPETGEGA